MELKTFRARTVSDAMAAVKAALGEDAIVVSTTPSRAGVEVTAHAPVKLSRPVADTTAFRSTPWAPSVDAPADLPRQANRAPAPASTAAPAARPAVPAPPPAAATAPGRIHTRPAPAATPNPLAHVQRELAEIKAMLASSLREKPAPSPIIPAAPPRPDPVDAILRAAGVQLQRKPGPAPTDPAQAARDELRHALPAIDLAATLAGPVALVGACGCGKTTALVKLASHLKLTLDRRVAILTLAIDPLEAEALARLADAMDLPFASLDEPADLPALLADLADVDVILIDTPGLNPAARADTDCLRLALTQAEVKPLAVLTATASPGAARRLAAQVRPFEPLAALLTRLDEAGALGHWVQCLSGAPALPVGALGEGPDGPEGLTFCSPNIWADRILAAAGTGLAS